MFPFAYHVVVCSELTDWKEEKRHGVTLAPTFKDAMDNIEKYYGEDLVNVFVGAINDEQTIIELPETFVCYLEEDAYEC